MYLSYYHLHHMPFQISPDPRFFWLGEKHKEALAVLKYGVLNNQGFLLLTGDVGTGKTTLINTLLNSLDSETVVINVSDPRLDKLDFFKLVSHSLGLDTKLRTKFDFITTFGDFLCRAHDSGKRVLLIIDEAHKLSLDSLEEIRLLSNIERQDTKLLNVFFIGQNEFNDTITRPECRALRQRVTIVHHIEPLNGNETEQYVKYRLRVAGTQEVIFTDRALKEVYRFSRGYPRLINIVCDRALLAGYSDDLQTIPPKVIRECVKNLRLPGEVEETTSKAMTKRLGVSLRRAQKAAIWLALGLLILFFGYVIATRFLGAPVADLRKYYGTLFRGTDQIQTQPVPGPVGKVEPSLSSPPTALPGQPSNEEASRQASQPADRNDRSKGAVSQAELKTEEASALRVGAKLVIPFGNDTNELPPEILVRLDELAGYMLQKTDFDATIRGHTDSLGSNEYNRSLSTFRANVVKSYLTGKGINPNRMRVIGMGNAAPRMANNTPQGRAANRRVEIELVLHKP
jgi:general secretion pathway protein A